jgi:hypothetical protein
MQEKIHQIQTYLENKYNPQIALLYGSFATNTSTQFSDIDCICFAEIDHFIHDSSIVADQVLDGWIYPLHEIENIDLLLHIIPCKVLIDKNNQSKYLIDKIINKRTEKTIIMKDDERKQLVGWIKKMINRSIDSTLEANYRYNWLIHDFPELYCKFKNEYYDGPVKTLNKLKENRELYNKYEIACKSKNIKSVKEIYSELIEEFI